MLMYGGVSVSAKAMTLACILQFVHKPGQEEDKKLKKKHTKEALHMWFL